MSRDNDQPQSSNLPDAMVERWLRPAIRSMQAYHVPDASGYIKLDAMENPYGWPQDIKSQWADLLQQAAINRYPDPDAKRLKDRLAQVFGVPQGIPVMLGNGSDELIQIIAMGIGGTGHKILAPEPSFVMYKLIAEVLGIEYIGVPLKDDFSLDQRRMLEAIEEHQPAAIFIASPNNPTGNLFEVGVVESIIAAAPGLVVVDEAYHIFAGESFLPRVNDYSNLLVMRTLSKVGLAGLRLGMLMGPEAWISQFEKIRLPYNINILTQLSVEFFLQHYALLGEQAAQIINDRQALSDELAGMEGFKVWPSQANFLLFQCLQRSATEVFGSLKEQGILIKNLHGSHPLLEDCLRVTIGKTDEVQRFVSALSSLA